jgi:hypothetical protein
MEVSLVEFHRGNNQQDPPAGRSAQRGALEQRYRRSAGNDWVVPVVSAKAKRNISRAVQTTF